MNKLKTTAMKLSAVLVTFALMVGCTSQATIAALTDTLGNAASAIAAVEGNTALATKLQTDTAAAVSAVKTWKSGTPAQMAIEALNLVQDDLQLIPATGPYVPLIDICIGAVDAILAELPASQAVTAHVGGSNRAIHLSQPAPKTAKQFKKQWNAYVGLNQGLNLPKL